jgi:hypothetical protein
MGSGKTTTKPGAPNKDDNRFNNIQQVAAAGLYGYGEPTTDPGKYLLKQQIVQDGQVYDVRSGSANQSGPFYAFPQGATDPSQAIQIGAGTYNTLSGKSISVDDKMKIIDSRTLSEKERSGLGLGGSGSLSGDSGSVYHATPYGFTAPDPAAAINGLMAQYEAQVAAGQMPREQALQQFEADLGAFNANLQKAEAANRDVRERQIAEADRRQGLLGTATDRATSISQNIIPNIIGGNAPSINVPFLGEVMGNNVNVPELYGQHLPDLATQWENGMIPAQSAVDFGGNIAAPTLPQYQAPALPDINGLIQQLQHGSGPLGFA